MENKRIRKEIEDLVCVCVCGFTCLSYYEKRWKDS